MPAAAILVSIFAVLLSCRADRRSSSAHQLSATATYATRRLEMMTAIADARGYLAQMWFEAVLLEVGEQDANVVQFVPEAISQ